MSFTEIQETFDASHSKSFPYVRLYGGKSYIVWFDYYDAFHRKLNLSSCNLDGTGWSTVLVAIITNSTDHFEYDFQIYDDKIYVPFTKNYYGNNEIYIGVCNLDGSSWSLTKVSSLGYTVNDLKFIVDDTIYLVWANSSNQMVLGSCNLDLSGFAVLSTLTSGPDYHYPTCFIVEGSSIYYGFGTKPGDTISIGKSALDGSGFSFAAGSIEDAEYSCNSIMVIDDSILLCYTFYGDDGSGIALTKCGTDLSGLTDVVLVADSVYYPWVISARYDSVRGQLVYVFTQYDIDWWNQVFLGGSRLDGSGFTSEQETFTEDDVSDFWSADFDGTYLYMIYERDYQLWFAWGQPPTPGGYAQANCIAVRAVIDAHTGQMITPT